MKKSLAQLAVGAALVLTVVPAVTAQEMQGRLFGGVESGVAIPLNALNRYSGVGGMISPFVGYKLFDDKDLQLNPGIVGSMEFVGFPGDVCGTNCRFTRVNGTPTFPRPGATTNALQIEHFNDPSYGLTFTAGPRLSLPIGPVELYGDWQVGGMTGLNSGNITDTSWGFKTGGGILYNLNENVGIGAFGRWQRYYQRVHGVGDVRYATTGLVVQLQQSPPPPPPPPAPPVAQAPPPPPPPIKKKLVLRGVNFDFDKYNIRPDAVPILEQACKTLKEEPNVDVSCDGYTDSIGTDAYNQRLSERRADAVRNWLVKCGIPASRLSTRGFGETNPVASNATAEGRAQNRRTELVVK
jgi:outer membrane protein OmpA-like peptidoglycan-associated protein